MGRVSADPHVSVWEVLTPESFEVHTRANCRNAQGRGTARGALIDDCANGGRDARGLVNGVFSSVLE